MASEQLNADLEVEELEVNSLTDGLTANNVRFATRVDALSEPENQLLLAKQLVLTGDWQALGSSRVDISKVSMSGAQLTVAYYGTGRSNLHEFLKQMNSVKVQKVSSVPLNWRVDEWLMEDVTINLFDKGEPILSVHVRELELTDLQSMQSADAQVKELLWPILEQVAEQVRDGNPNLQVDSMALSRFLLREAMAF
ncbi:hypothetical protein IG389_06960 [Idiomarina abyssalis]|uniref:Uncharacterized protein n=3 Tax=Idiomarinaceae TaxID=267893 RepID=A0A8I1G2Y0_9GAMM|nr:hypothetical protein ADS78_04715 [Idiomarina abyssalis]MAL84388.1 hypothetical protein [Idiomarina sp.]MBJ7267179.1 hypothetical protein [Idiomarina abyssalis]MBJ7273660.1 hypothetical protein [Idiomarina abyssalis]MBJ7314963.1 hypothetical protein [Idiomarina abyssalis]